MELGCCKYPPARYLSPYWRANREALLKYIELVHNTGIRGFVFDDKGRPIEGAKIIIENRAKKVKTYKDGDYWRLLVPGNYIIRVAKRKYKNSKKTITVDPDAIAYANFTLVRKRSKNFSRRRLAAKMNPVAQPLKSTNNVSFHKVVTHRDKLRLSAKSPGKSASTVLGPFIITSLVCFVLVALLK